MRLVVVASMLVAIVASGVLWARAGWVGVAVTALVAAGVVIALVLPWVDWPARGKTD